MLNQLLLIQDCYLQVLYLKERPLYIMVLKVAKWQDRLSTPATLPVPTPSLSLPQAHSNNGRLYDSYTTFKGRFGNYGNNILTNIWGTTARRLNLPDKPRIPADGIRKIKNDVNLENGLIDLTGNKDFRGKPHINITIDRPVVAHESGWDGADTYIFPFRNFLKQTKGSLVSIEPSDVFANGTRVLEKPQNVTIISGDVEALKKAKKSGMQTLSSPKLRKLYKEAYDNFLIDRLEKHPKSR